MKDVLMDNKLFHNDQNKSALIITGIISLLFFTAFTAYSTFQYNSLSRRSIIKNHVVMKVIQHGVKSVCPTCGFKGVASCPQCALEMYWNGYRGTFICPGCGKGGFPQCKRCNEFMTWIENL